MKVVTAWLNNNDARTQLAQRRMLRSVLDRELDPLIVNGTPRPLLNEMLTLARSLSPARGWFIWLNSDCEIADLPRPLPDKVIGLHRVESDGSGICPGVDGYIMPCEIWDKHYAPDLPQMYVGGTHVDWWLTRLAQARGCYQAVVALKHISHARTQASAGIDAYGQHNLDQFHAWANRNGIPTEYEL
jgi:hypothetical protein